MEPALRRDNSAEVDVEVICCLVSLLLSSDNNETGLNGLVDGVGLEVFGIRVCSGLWFATASPGENRDGTVPALALRVGV